MPNHYIFCWSRLIFISHKDILDINTVKHFLVHTDHLIAWQQYFKVEICIFVHLFLIISDFLNQFQKSAGQHTEWCIEHTIYIQDTYCNIPTRAHYPQN